MDKPTKPTNLMPRSFGGIKENFSASMQETGVEPNVPTIYSGKNFNYQLDATGKELDYCETICDFINGIPIGKTITVDANNKLQYADLGQDVPIATTETAGIVKPDGETIIVDENGVISTQGGSSRNIGEIVTSTLPLTEAELHLLDGALINGSGSYADFVDYMANKYNEGTSWVTFTQPNATSNTTALSEGYMTCSSSGSPTSTYEAWKAFDNSPTTTCWRIGSTSGWLQVKFPYQIKITGLTFYSGTSTSYLANNCQFYTSNSKTTPIGNAFQGSSSTYTSTTITGIPTTGIITDTLYLDITSSHSTGISCGHIAITGQKFEIPQYFCSESTWQSTVTQYGVCEKFVYDQTNNTVRLPKYGSQIYTKNSTVASTVPVKGNGTTIGLTNGSSNYGLQTYSSSYSERLTAATGSYNKPVGSSYSSSTLSTGETLGLTADASKSGIVGDTSSLLTQYPLGCYYYIVVATSANTNIEVNTNNVRANLKSGTTSTQNSIKVDINKIMEDLNGKADVDLTNINDKGFIKMAAASMPSNTYIDVTLGASGTTYIAPADGWVVFTGTANAQGQYVCMISLINNLAIQLENVTTNRNLQCFIPVKKGENYAVSYNVGGTKNLRFIYAKGSESEVL